MELGAWIKMKETLKRIWYHLTGRGFEYEWKREQKRIWKERFEIEHYYNDLLMTFAKNNALDPHSVKMIFGNQNREIKEWRNRRT